MKKEELFEILGELDEAHIQEAAPARPKSQRRAWGKWGGLAACLCLILGLGMFAVPKLLHTVRPTPEINSGETDGCGFGDTDSTLLPVHREDFSPELPKEIETAFAEEAGVMKVYRTLTNSWFLAKDLTDFSQALTTNAVYVAPKGGKNGNIPPWDSGYIVYTIDENGEPYWCGATSTSETVEIPNGLLGLTTDMIEEDLMGIDYEDYIITESENLSTVFVWARCADGQDVFVTYPTRPEFVGLQNHGRYTLKQLQRILTKASKAS